MKGQELDGIKILGNGRADQAAGSACNQVQWLGGGQDRRGRGEDGRRSVSSARRLRVGPEKTAEPA